MKQLSAEELSEARRLARQLGLDRIADSDLEMLLNAAKLADTRRGALDVASLSPVDEPAHVFVLPAAR